MSDQEQSGFLGIMVVGQFTITVGRTYIYIADLPKGYKDCMYKVVRFIIDYPSLQEKVLVEGVSGKDKGRWFSCSPSNFSYRYVPLVEQADYLDPQPEIPCNCDGASKVADMTSKEVY